MKKVIIAAAAVALWAPGAHAGSQEAPAEANAEAEGHTSANTVVCRRVAAPTGSRIGARRICKTQSEWDAISAAARNEVEDAQLRSKPHTGG